MKRTISLFFLAAIAALCISVPVQANNVLTVFEGDEYGYSPINTPYLDEVGTRTQSIYPASELAEMTNDVINSVTFYASDVLSVSQGVINVLVGETSQDSFYGNDYIEGLTQVATIAMVPGTTELVITFDTPYLYQGGNLVVETQVIESTECCYIPFFGFRPTNYSTVSRGEVSKFLPKATFNYGTDEAFSAKVVPDEVTFNTIRAEREDVQTVVVTNNGKNAFTASFTTEAPFALDLDATELAAGASLEVPVTFAPLQPGEYRGTLTIDCGEAGTLTASLSGTAIEAAQDLVVGDKTDYASFVPIYGTDIDIVGTQGQMIYPETMLTDLVGSNLIGLKFHTYRNVQMKGGVIQLSLKIVDHTVFTRPVAETEVTAVATVSPTYNGTDLEFEFFEPFEYNGGHLLVECLVTEAGVTNYSPTYFYGTPTENSNVALYTTIGYYGTETDFVPFLPMATFTYQKSSVITLRGDANDDKDVNISDAITLINAILNDNWTGINRTNANVDYNENVDISDVIKLINYILNGSWPD